MSLNDTVSAERLHIGFFGLRNAGKSSVVNAVTGQNLALVSDVKGTTTDPVQKAMELLPLGPVVIIDTPGIDDEGELGRMRVERAISVLSKTDVAVLVVDATVGLSAQDRELCAEFEKKSIPYIIAFNKADLLEKPDSEKKFAGSCNNVEAGDVSSENACSGNGNDDDGRIISESDGIDEKNREQKANALREHGQSKNEKRAGEIYVSALKGTNIYELKELIGSLAGKKKQEKKLVGDLLSPGDVVVLVTPIDESAPKGRMILPQQQMIRDVLDHDAVNIVVKETDLEQALAALKESPRMVITDSQAFGVVNKIVPPEVPLTSFSILFARYKGELDAYAKGAAKLDNLKDGDKILISEGCTHHRQCNDIGTVKLPGWVENYTGKKLEYEFTSGGDFPKDLSEYALIIHCGACMLNEREVMSRINTATENGTAITNYGIAIAKMHGILERSLSPFVR